MTKRTYQLGPLPETPEDYSQYEEDVVRWDRVASFGALVVAVLAVSIWFYTGTDVSDENADMLAVEHINQLEAPAAGPVGVAAQIPAMVDPAGLASSPAAPADKGSVKSTSGSLVLVQEELVSESVDSSESELESDMNSVDAETPEPVEALAEQVISPVTSLHVGMLRAELSSEVVDKEPLAPLGYNIPMSDEGIIKVVLFTEMEGLKGTVLYHEWYLDDAPQARVKIPVSIDRQRSYSSKFINQQMLGDWRVKVVDASGELYAEANFRVD